MTMFNLLSVVRTALRTHAKKMRTGEAKSSAAPRKERRLSMYYLADEVAGVWRGMEIVIPPARWEETFATLTPKQLARTLQWLSSQTDVRRFYTHPWTPKRPQPKRISGHRGNHVATYQILQKRPKTTEQSAGKH